MLAQTPGLAGMAAKTDKRKFWNFVDNGETAELQLFGTIESEESWWEDDCVTYRSFISELDALGDKKEIHVSIHSAGGDVFAANAIYTALSMHKAAITGTVLGLCASAATIVLMACGRRRIAKNAVLMAHNPSVSLWGSYQSDELKKLAEVTDTVKKSIVEAYMGRLGKTEEEISQLMDEESWYVGQEAVDAGFCDETIEMELRDSVCMDRIIVDGVHYTFRNYLKKFAPDSIREKALAFSGMPKGAAGAFTDTKNRKGGREDMGEESNMAVPEIKDTSGLKKAYPELCANLMAEAANAERERLKAIDEIAAGIPADMLEQAKYTEPVTAADLALAQMKANSRAGQRFMEGLEEDLAASGAAAIGGEPNAGYDPEGQKKAEAGQKIGRFVAKLKNDKRREKE